MTILRVLGLLVLMILSTTTQAGGLAPRFVGPLRSWGESDLARTDARWIQIKFVEGSGVD